MRWLLLFILVPLMLFAGPATAEGDLDVTMCMVTGQESASDNIAREIKLPDTVSDRAREAAAPGLERAREASERGREAAEAARGRAQKGLERRSERRELPGIGPPKNPGAPDNPGDARS